MKLEGYTRTDRKMHEKERNLETQNDIMDYLDINQKLFERILNIDEVKDRILHNLKSDIQSGMNSKENLLEKIYFMTCLGGGWNPNINQIRMNPRIKLESMLSKEKQKNIIRLFVMN